MRYRHERMIQAREERKRHQLEREQEVADLLLSCLTDDELLTWVLLSHAIEHVA